jgi:hypothetical protein
MFAAVGVLIALTGCERGPEVFVTQADAERMTVVEPLLSAGSGLRTARFHYVFPQTQTDLPVPYRRMVAEMEVDCAAMTFRTVAATVQSETGQPLRTERVASAARRSFTQANPEFGAVCRPWEAKSQSTHASLAKLADAYGKVLSRRKTG